MDLFMMGFDGSDWKGSKMGKTEDYYSSVSSSKQMLRSNSSLSDEQNMLSFSMTDSKTGGFGLCNNTSSGYNTNTGYGCGGGLSVRGPFTPSQWMELEHQALIYKYILSNVPVPSNLLFPIKKALDSAGFSIGPLRPNTYGWGAFHLGFSSNTDPEPGRCRRTDGKKWRCSRDACPDQKYCERHINRGRHRSRKPVEALNAHSVSSVTSAKLVIPGASCCGEQTQLKSLQLCGPNSSDSSRNMNMNFVNNDIVTERTQAATDLSMFSSGINLKNNQFSIEKKQNPCNESEFGLVFSDSLLNPFHKTPSETLITKEKSSQGSVHQFIDEWPKNQLITSSSNEEKLAFSPLRLSSTDLNINEQSNRQTNWVPISWESSIGGPLAEALHNTNQTSFQECNNTVGIASSPNGPLQRMAFGSQTNSSASSPRGGATSLAQLL